MPTIIRPATDADSLGRPRLDALDLIRGIAILGIFLMNTQDMSMPVLAYYNPYAYDAAAFIDPTQYTGLSAMNYAVFVAVHVVADLKFITIFSMLFGAGILLQGERLAARGLSAARIHYGRMAVLLAFGLIHAYAFWYGDVLAPYALCGMLLFPFRTVRTSMLMAIGLLFLSVATIYHWADARHLDNGLIHWLHDGTARLTDPVTGNDFEYAAYSGSWMQQMRSRFWVSLDNETFSFLDWTLWRCGGAMLIGMGLLRARFFHAVWRGGIYRLLAAVWIPIGWSLTWLGVLHNQSHGWFGGAYPDFAGMEFNYWGSLVAAVGYMALGVLLAIRVASPQATILKRIVVPIRAVGRTALSNYLLQSVIGTTIFYGHGFGYFGWLTRAQLLGVVACVWLFQLFVSTLWTRRFQQGPLEFVWHRIVYQSTKLRSTALVQPE
jgi:uncharacterized protein